MNAEDCPQHRKLIDKPGGHPVPVGVPLPRR